MVARQQFADVMARARSGDQAALRQLYESHRERVFRVAYGVLGDADDAEDVMQDVMIQALRDLDRYDPSRAAFGTWLHTLTVNRCRDRLRRGRALTRHLPAMWRADAERAPGSMADVAERIDVRRRVGAAMAELTSLQREAVVLRDVEEMSLAEVAAVLGVPLRTAQSRINAAYAAMRRQLMPAAPSPGDGADAGGSGKGDA